MASSSEPPGLERRSSTKPESLPAVCCFIATTARLTSLPTSRENSLTVITPTLPSSL